MKICVAIPSRGRPSIAGGAINLPHRLVTSALDNAKDPDNVRIRYYLNDDDKTLDEYHNFLYPLTKQYPNSVFYDVGPDQSTVESWNKIAAVEDCELSMMAGDEIVFRTKHWDEKMRETRRNHKNGIYVMNFWYDKLKYTEDFRTKGSQPVVTREWYKPLGWHFPPYFLHWYVDTYTMKLGVESKTLIYRDDIEIIQKKIMDDTAKRMRTNKIKERDKWLFDLLVKTTLPNDVNKIRKAINES